MDAEDKPQTPMNDFQLPEGGVIPTCFNLVYQQREDSWRYVEVSVSGIMLWIWLGPPPIPGLLPGLMAMCVLLANLIVAVISLRSLFAG